MALGGFVLGSLILYLKGVRTTMFQLSGFYCKSYQDPMALSWSPYGPRVAGGSK